MPVAHDLTCPECGARMALRNSVHGLFYGCSRYPECEGTHGAHPDGRPLGTPANKETKAARIRAHDAFDKLWQPGSKGGRQKRSAAYRWLASRMGLSVNDCHIGGMDAEQCEQVVDLVRERLFRENRLA